MINHIRNITTIQVITHTGAALTQLTFAKKFAS